MKRQTFLRAVTGTTLGLTAVAGGWLTLRGSIRVRPQFPDVCGRSFLAFCERARFATAEEAVQITARRGQAFELYLAGDDPQALSPGIHLPIRGDREQLGQGQPASFPATAQETETALRALKTAQHIHGVIRHQPRPA